MLGCDGDVLPAGLTAGRAFFDLSMVRHLGPNADGVRLTTSS
jgi:hypothetical protein